jgi:NTP pyrophosphatase (non-canonical NTP hydrolase)
MSELKDHAERIRTFCQERDWEQFHNPKDLALSLVLEAAEVLEHFQWKSPDEMAKYVATNKNDIAEELADVYYWVVYLSDRIGVDLAKAFEEKMRQNEAKYPIAKAKGKHTKYNQL